MSALAAEVGELLLARGEQLTLAESCTGGLIANLITDIAGCSSWFERGLITYSNRSKQELLGVPAEVLERHGAVSAETVRAMVQGLLAASPADWGIAVTGIAGPDGGSADKPVGTVWLGWQRRGGKLRMRCDRFAGDRAAVREQAADAALLTLLQMLRDASSG